MKTIVLLLSYALAGLGGQITNKLNSDTAGKSRAVFAFYLTANGVIACLFFFVTGGFRVAFSLPTLLYALLYAAVVVFSILFQFLSLQRAAISNVNVMSNAGTLLLGSALGFALFRESIGPVKLLRILLMLAGVLLIFRERRGETKPARGFLPAIGGLVAITVGGNLVLKFYTQTPATTDETSFFFLTNAVLVIGSAVWFLWLWRKERFPLRPLLRPRILLPVAGNTVCSNISSLLSLQLIGMLELSVFTPLTGALGALTNLLASLLFREKLGISSYLAAALALIAAII